tara:strand:+ start:923 stop:1213 length:291 start_codon:yes stop_codon:yes gene_type:complete
MICTLSSTQERRKGTESILEEGKEEERRGGEGTGVGGEEVGEEIEREREIEIGDNIYSSHRAGKASKEAFCYIFESQACEIREKMNCTANTTPFAA